MIPVEDLIRWVLYALENRFGYIWGKCGVIWTNSRQVDLERKYKADPSKYANYKMGALYGSRWIGHKVVDCANLIRWAAKQAGAAVHSSSNLIWKCDIAKRGKLNNGSRADGETLKPGTLIFTGTANEHGHVGMYAGNGEVVEAAGTLEGVIKSRVTASKWTFWGELKCTAFDGVPVPDPAPDPAPDPEPVNDRPKLRRGSKGETVKTLQRWLVDLGYDIGSSGVDGSFGAATEKAVKAFQKANGLSADGIVGPKTWAAFLGDPTPAPAVSYAVTVCGLTREQVDRILTEYPGAVVIKEVS